MSPRGATRFLLPSICGAVLASGLVMPAYAADSPAPSAAAGSSTAEPASTPRAPEARSKGPAVVDLGSSLCDRDVPLGMVRLAGPGGTRLLARVTTVAKDRVLTITGGSGRIGGVRLTDADFGGRLTYSAGSFEGSVTIDLAGSPRIASEWTQSTKATATASGCQWKGSVLLRTTTPGGRIDLRGPLASDGSYSLRGVGSVSFAGTRIPLSGSLTSATSTTAATWRITGTGTEPGSLAGVRILRPRIDMTSSAPRVMGTATVALSKPALLAPATLSIGSHESWRATVTGSNLPQWTMPGNGGITVTTGKLSGSIGQSAGKPLWNLAAPGSVSTHGLDLGLRVGLIGPGSYRVSATGGRGHILGLSQEMAFTAAPGALTIDSRGIRGSLAVSTRGRFVMEMPAPWSSTTTYVLQAVSEGGWSFTHRLVHTISHGASRITLSGPVDESGGVHLTASGTFQLEKTAIPVSGFYDRANFDPATRPIWSLVADITKARDGRVDLGHGAALAGGRLVFGEVAAPTTATSQALASTTYPVSPGPVVSPNTCTTTYVLLDENNPFQLPVNCLATTDSDYTLTIAGKDATNVFRPFADDLDFGIPETSFHGTISSTSDGGQVWNAWDDSVTWTNMATGLTLTSAFTITNSCTLTPQRCPGDEGIYFAGDGSLDFVDTSLPDLVGPGSFLADGSWARWDATSPQDVPFELVTVSQPDLVVWRGQRAEEGADLDMPDLSSYNGHGIGVEFCGNFKIDVPDVVTATTTGCVEWTHAGVVVGQVAMGGDIKPADWNQVSMKGIVLNGFATSTLADPVGIGLNGKVLTLDKGTYYITAAVTVDGQLMHDLGVRNSLDYTMTATGWYADTSSFSLDASIPVNLSGGGATLKEVLVHVGKDSSGFTLKLDAEADVSISGNHFPVDAYIGIKKQGDTSVTVGLTATGTPSLQSQGTMDFVTLLPGGDFEPTNGKLIDGSSDGRPPKDALSDGGFESMTSPGELIVDAGFESAKGTNYLPDPDFEDGSTGNLLPNSDFEDANLLVNGDLEEYGGSLLGWSANSHLRAGTIAGTAPTDDTGLTIAKLQGDGMTPDYVGMTQTVPVRAANTTVEFSLWATTLSSTSGSAGRVDATIVGVGCSVTVTRISLTPSVGQWLSGTVQATVPSGCTAVTAEVSISGFTTQYTYGVDALELKVTSAPGPLVLPTTWRPHLVATFDSLSTTPLMSGHSSSGVSIATDYPGTLSADGKQNWTLYDGTTGSAQGDFDVSYKVMFPRNSSSSQDAREMASFGYWLQWDTSSTMSGYCFRLQVSGAGDGGFYQCSSGSATAVSGGPVVPDLQRDTWYEVRLTAVGKRVTAHVSDATTGALVWQGTASMPSASYGQFGGVAQCCSNPAGIRWDDISFYSLQGDNAVSSFTPVTVWRDSTRAHSGSGAATIPVSTWGSKPVGYTTGVQPKTGETYTYTTWLRAASGTVGGSIALTAAGSGDESTSTAFSVGTTWTEVSTTLTVAHSGHTDLRPTIKVTSGSAELQVDDQSLQQVPWAMSAGGVAQVVTSDDSVSPSKVMRLITGTSALTASVNLGRPAAAGATYHLGMWIKAPSGMSGSIGLASNSNVRHDFPADGTWHWVTTNLTGSAGPTSLVAKLNISQGDAGRVVLIDDVSLKVTGLDSSQSALGAPPVDTNWAGEYEGERIPTVLVNDDTRAHSGNGAMVITSMSGKSIQETYVSTLTPRNGSSWRFRTWINSSASTSNLVISLLCDTANSAATVLKSAAITSPGTGYVQRTIVGTASGCTGPLTARITSTGDATPVTIYIDDVSLTETGLEPADSWSIWPHGAPVGIEGHEDDTTAHSGSGYLTFTNPTSSGSETYVHTDDTYRAVMNDLRTMTAWVKSGTSTSVAGSITIITTTADGTHVQEISQNFTAGSGWQRVYVDLPITVTKDVAFIRTQFSLPLGATLLVDDLSARSMDNWRTDDAASVGAVVIPDYDLPVDGRNVLLTRSNTTSHGVTLVSAGASARVGSSFELRAYARSTGDDSATGTLLLTPSRGTPVSVPIVAGPEWASAEITWVSPYDDTITFTAKIIPPVGHEMYVDAVTLKPVVIVQASPWTAEPSVTATDLDDPATAHGGSYGALHVTSTTSGHGVTHIIPSTVPSGHMVNVNAWVMSPDDTVTGSLRLETTAGVAVGTPISFAVGGGTWVNPTLSVKLTAAHSDLRVHVVLDHPGTLILDDVVAQDNPWTLKTTSASGSQTVIYDGAHAQSGSSYLQVSMSGGGSNSNVEVDCSMTAPAAMGGVFKQGQTYTYTTYVRSHTGAGLNVKLLGGTQYTDTKLVDGTDWQPYSVSFTPATDQSTVTVGVRLLTNNATVDIDSGTLTSTADQPTDDTTIPHPEYGYTYLWDKAFGIPGAHLWQVTAQLQYEDGLPGFGIGATLYQDPTQAPLIMHGTDWLRGDMVVNFSEADPCFSFDFAAPPGGNSSVWLANGVFDSPDFAISFAPRGCEVGDYVVPRGASLSFDDYLGDGLLHLSLSLSEGDNGPVFDEQLGLTNIVINGTAFTQADLDIHLESGKTSITLDADMTLPAGGFSGLLALSRDGGEVALKGSMTLTDWTWKGGGLNLEEFTLDLNMNDPGPGKCVSFDNTGTGTLDIADKTGVSFHGDLAMNCGKLEKLVFSFQYSHAGTYKEFDLSYDSDSRTLAGGVEFDFEREFSWKFLSHKYVRHPQFGVKIAFSMDTTDPSTAEATIEGHVSVSGGHGDLTCELHPTDDSCDISVHVDAGGGHTYSSSW